MATIDSGNGLYVWNTWNDQCTGGTDTSITNNVIYQTWVVTCSSVLTTSNPIYNNTVWYNWQTADGTLTVDHKPFVDTRTAAEKAADVARWETERAATQQRAAEAEVIRSAARDKARALLVSMLSVQQREQLKRCSWFDVIGSHSQQTYRIREGSHGNVRLLSPDGQKEVASYCGQPNGVPVGDSMLAQKLQLECDETEYLRLANRSPRL